MARGNMMMIKEIKTEKDHQKELSRIEELMDAEPNTPEGDELDFLVTLVEKYEVKNYQ
jgi:HTH-type transcriptional regulator/antitoxin HigA